MNRILDSYKIVGPHKWMRTLSGPNIWKYHLSNMSDLQLNNLMPFLNLKRPTLQHFSVTVRICLIPTPCSRVTRCRSCPRTFWALSCRPSWSHRWKSPSQTAPPGPNLRGYGRIFSNDTAFPISCCWWPTCEWFWTAKSPRWRCMKRLVSLAYRRMSFCMFFQLQAELNDQKFEQWIVDTRTSVSEELGQQSMLILSCCHIIIYDGWL